MLRAEDVARYFLANQDAEHGGSISNLKVQKLCYYAQGIALALLGKPLFLDDIVHWEHGPVVPTVYHNYQSHRGAAIPAPEDLDLTLYDRETQGLLDKVHRVYGQDSAWDLREKTQEEPPWINTPDGAAITHQKMRIYFQSLPALSEYFGEFVQENIRHLPENPQVMKDLKRGIEAFKSGRMVAWDEVKEELGIE
ncbi:MAG: DUF4065 domain-containing protein [Chloroflexi bacterium]|nr:DUF4065 domain-containing protein [Chloroflexota bacterium]